MGVALMYRNPDKLDRCGGLWRKSEIIAGVKTNAAIIGDKTGVPLGHCRLNGLEISVHQSLRIRILLLQLIDAAAERAADLFHIGCQQRLRNADLLIKLHDKLQRIQRQRPAIFLLQQ